MLLVRELRQHFRPRNIYKDYKEVIKMAVEKVGEKYRCNVCGNEVTVTKVGGGTLVCCGEDMELIE